MMRPRVRSGDQPTALRKNEGSNLWQEVSARKCALSFSSDRLNFYGLRSECFGFFPVNSGFAQVSVDYLLHLRHQRSQGLVPGIETTANCRARGNRGLVSLPRFG